MTDNELDKPPEDEGGTETGQQLYETAYRAYVEKDFLPAAAVFAEVLTREEETALRAPTLFYLGHCYFEAGEYALASHFLEMYLSLYADGEFVQESLFYSGVAYYYEGDGYSARLRLQQIESPLWKQQPAYSMILAS
jgi:TolA-binding protein